MSENEQPEPEPFGPEKIEAQPDELERQERITRSMFYVDKRAGERISDFVTVPPPRVRC